MKVIPTQFTVAEYCNQMKNGDIIVNRDYQRSNKVWPPAARSYLIDTILLGFPVPKLSLYQQLDVKSKKSYKEIVDGQQRSQAILDFFNNELRISGKSEFTGKTFEQLDDEDKAHFLEYSLSTDVFVNANENDIRQVFRRINAYTVPLNPQELRHAEYQGDFKWYMVDLTERYAPILKDIGVFSEQLLSRMNDAQLLTEIIMAIQLGIVNSDNRNIDKFYAEYDHEFPYKQEIEARFANIFKWFLHFKSIHRSNLTKQYNFYSLALAITHTLNPTDALSHIYPVTMQQEFQRDIVSTNLSILQTVLDESEGYEAKFSDFIKACSAGTNRIEQRTTRFKYYCRALEPNLI
jgi:hypothetical protein